MTDSAETDAFLAPDLEGGVIDGDGKASSSQSHQPVPAHTTAAVFHVAFKAAALVLYLGCGIVSCNFILVCVFSVLLHAFDFWTVKNVSGRLLVGLRWWSEVLEDGSNRWIYETKPASRRVNAQDSLIFWMALWATPAVWLFYGALALFQFKFKWLLVVGVGVVLSSANLLGYWKCSRAGAAGAGAGGSGESMQSFLTNKMMAAAVKVGIKNAVASATGGGLGGGNGADSI